MLCRTGLVMSGRRPLIKDSFCRVAMVVGAVMSPAWLCEDKMRPAGPDVVRVIPGPIMSGRRPLIKDSFAVLRWSWVRSCLRPGCARIDRPARP